MEINPAINPDGIIDATYCPTDGYIRPAQILKDCLEAATRAGAEFVFGAKELNIIARESSQRKTSG
ncbi:MAG: hypothetical protein M1369_05590 [Deinococcus sp.]|nr:hypothetical protein [Deinococcus sp.]MCL5965242.1 hypothetical protein [Deinococcus sp.]